MYRYVINEKKDGEHNRILICNIRNNIGAAATEKDKEKMASSIMVQNVQNIKSLTTLLSLNLQVTPCCKDKYFLCLNTETHTFPFGVEKTDTIKS